MADGSKLVVYAALAGNLLIAVTKGVAAAITGSSGMLSEAVHSLVDTGNEVLLLYGMKQSAQKPDEEHPLGHGRELYFWSFVVAVLIFGVGAGVSVYEGVVHLADPEPIKRPMVSYIVLGISALFEGTSWIIALREFNKTRGEQTVAGAIRDSKDPPKFMVLLEDSAALIGIAMALAGTWASVHFRDPRFDGYASLGIGAVLAVVSIILLRESKALLIGERADPQVRDEVARAAGCTPGIERVNGVLTVQLAPDQVFVALSLKFEAGLDIADVERIVDDVEKRVREKRPEVIAVFLKPQTREGYHAARGRLLDAPQFDPSRA